MKPSTADDPVAETMKRIQANERVYRAALAGAVALEGMFLAAFLMLADLNDRTHVLLLLTFAALLSVGALAVGAFTAAVNRHTLRVLRSVELLDRAAGDG
jgi:hypothetical protein